jgi:hypothetical protein
LMARSDVGDAQCPTTNRCPECRSSHESPSGTPTSGASRVVRDERPNTLETLLDSELFYPAFDVGRGHGLRHFTAATASARGRFARFCRFTI